MTAVKTQGGAEGCLDLNIFLHFSEWLIETGRPAAFEGMDKAPMASMLKFFYGEVRQVNGSPYSRSGLVNIRSAIQRHISSPPFNREFNIMKDSEFNCANQVVQGTIKTLRERGLDVTKHKTAIDADDMSKIRQSLDVNTPVGLQDKVFVDVVLHFARRGREGLREMGKGFFIIKKNSKGLLYTTPSFNELDKNHSGQDPKVKDPQKVMTEEPHDPNCPVKTLQKYMSKLNPKCDAFFQRPKSKFSPHDTIWYENAPLGKNKLAQKMAKISVEAQCSERYTNHCLRATAATALSHAGVAPNDICAVTGHRSAESLRHYVEGPSMEQRQSMSHILHSYGRSSSGPVHAGPVLSRSPARPASGAGPVRVGPVLPRSPVMPATVAGPVRAGPVLSRSPVRPTSGAVPVRVGAVLPRSPVIPATLAGPVSIGPVPPRSPVQPNSGSGAVRVGLAPSHSPRAHPSTSAAMMPSAVSDSPPTSPAIVPRDNPTSINLYNSNQSTLASLLSGNHFYGTVNINFYQK